LPQTCRCFLEHLPLLHEEEFEWSASLCKGGWGTCCKVKLVRYLSILHPHLYDGKVYERAPASIPPTNQRVECGVVKTEPSLLTKQHPNKLLSALRRVSTIRNASQANSLELSTLCTIKCMYNRLMNCGLRDIHVVYIHVE
jgi:hypothetical protein